MSKILTILFVVFSIQLSSQNYKEIYFDSQSSADSQIVIDYNSNTNNIWQIGQPSKIVFDSARSPIRAIMTDNQQVKNIGDAILPYLKLDVITFSR